MQTLQIDKNKARVLYPKASDEIKAIFEETFGKEFFSEKITHRVKTFEDAINILGDKVSNNVGTLLAYTGIDRAMLTAKYAAMLSIICEALNEGWTPDWTNSREYKYYPWFKMVSGCGLSYHDYAYWATISCVGVRLCFKSSELAEYAGKQFLSIYQGFMCL